MVHLFFNNRFYPASTPLFTAANRGYRYGEGLFETLVYANGQTCFLHDHTQRLLSGLTAIGITVPGYFTPAFIEQTIDELARKNGLQQARIRLSVTAGNGLLHSFEPRGFELLIESFPLENFPGKPGLPGWTLGLLPGAQKTVGILSPFKTASHLVYALAARHAVNNGWNDCLVLNTNGSVCDTSIANMFLIKNNEFFTPPLASGCIDGVLRKKLLQALKANGFAASEKELFPDDVAAGDELFITNVVQGIRSIRSYNEKEYDNRLTGKIAAGLLPAIYSSPS